MRLSGTHALPFIRDMAAAALATAAAGKERAGPLGLPTIFNPQCISLGRPGRPEEVASLVVWLCLEGTYVTGQSLPLDGGLLCHP
jgi:NAD(P)-dependent dehydrogenase (short-subunit alcohol dehydrogenase family)